MPVTYEDSTIDAHTTFNDSTIGAEVEVELHHTAGTREKIRITRTQPTRTPYEVRIDIYDDDGLNKPLPVAHTTSVRGYSNAAVTARNLISDAANVIPAPMQRTALRLIQLGSWLDPRDFTGPGIRNLTGYNPWRSNQEFFTGEFEVGHSTKYYTTAVTPPAPPRDEMRDRLETQAVRQEYSNLSERGELEYNSPYADAGDDDRKDPTDLVELTRITAAESLDEVRRIRSDDETTNERCGDTGNDEWETDPEQAEQASLSGF